MFGFSMLFLEYFSKGIQLIKSIYNVTKSISKKFLKEFWKEKMYHRFHKNCIIIIIIINIY